MTADELKRIGLLYARGDMRGVQAQGQALLEREPHNAQMLQIVGIAHCQSGDAATGLQYLKRALRIDPESVDLRINAARALLDLRRFDEAEQICALLPAQSSNPLLVRMRAQIVAAAGQPAAAAKLYREVVAVQPSDGESWNNLGTALQAAGDAEGAVEALTKARSLMPNETRVSVNLAAALVAAGREDEGIGQLESALQSAPDQAAASLELGKALIRVGRAADALPHLGNAARLDQRNPECFLQIGLAFAALEQPERAEQSYTLAIRADPKDPRAYLNLGILLEQSNRITELEKLLASASGAGVQGGELDFLKALSLRRQGKFEEALRCAQGAETDAIDAPLKWQFIGKAADRLDDVDTAFAAFERMNAEAALQPGARRFDGSEHRQYVEDLASFTTSEWYRQWPPLDLSAEPPSPVFLVGFPRSGTTLLDTVLMGHPDTHVVEEVPIISQLRAQFGDLRRLAEAEQDEIQSMREAYFVRLNAASPPPVGKLVIDKLPFNFLRVALIHRLFPDARFVFALRHPCDVVLSCFMQSFKVNQAMASFLDLRNAALFYDRALSYWMQCQEVFPLRVHHISYESMLSDLEGSLRPLLEHLDLPWDDALLDYRQTAVDRGFIRTPSYSQVTEQLYDRARGRWRRYAEHMREVLPILSPWAERFGYGPVTD